MKNIVINLVCFAGGLAIGSYGMYKLMYRKIEEEVYAEYTYDYDQENQESEEETKVPEEPKKEDDETTLITNIKENADIIKKAGYVNYADTKGDATVFDEAKKVAMIPKLIQPEEFMDIPEYESISCYYDEVTQKVYNADGTVMNNVEQIIGMDNLNCFGLYEPDAIHIRNDDMKLYIEVLIKE